MPVIIAFRASQDITGLTVTDQYTDLPCTDLDGNAFENINIKANDPKPSSCQCPRNPQNYYRAYVKFRFFVGKDEIKAGPMELDRLHYDVVLPQLPASKAVVAVVNSGILENLEQSILKKANDQFAPKEKR